MQPASGSQTSIVQGLESSQDRSVPPHTPPEQPSSSVHTLPSLQTARLVVLTQPSSGSQRSFVHSLPSSQGVCPPAQSPSAQVSIAVQGLSSSQGALLGGFRQPLPESQRSSVHGFESSQSAALGVCAQPESVLHASTVQAIPSLQLSAVP